MIAPAGLVLASQATGRGFNPHRPLQFSFKELGLGSARLVHVRATFCGRHAPMARPAFGGRVKDVAGKRRQRPELEVGNNLASKVYQDQPKPSTKN